MDEFNNRIALVTGAGRGIGKATAVRFAAEGAGVVALDVNGESADRTAAEIAATGQFSASYPCDLSDITQIDAVCDDLERRGIAVDFLVNNAGISRYKPILDCDVADWDEHLNIMARATFWMMRRLVPSMMAREFGRVINLGSYVAQLNCTTKYFAPYCAAKFAIIGLTQVAAQEFAPFVTVNAIGPGDVATEMMEIEWIQEAEMKGSTPAEVKEVYRRRLLLQEFETGADIANAIVWLCSAQAAHVTGAHQIVGGGLPYKVMP